MIKEPAANKMLPAPAKAGAPAAAEAGETSVPVAAGAFAPPACPTAGTATVAGDTTEPAPTSTAGQEQAAGAEDAADAGGAADAAATHGNDGAATTAEPQVAAVDAVGATAPPDEDATDDAAPASAADDEGGAPSAEHKSRGVDTVGGWTALPPADANEPPQVGGAIQATRRGSLPTDAAPVDAVAHSDQPTRSTTLPAHRDGASAMKRKVSFSANIEEVMPLLVLCLPLHPFASPLSPSPSPSLSLSLFLSLCARAAAAPGPRPCMCFFALAASGCSVVHNPWCCAAQPWCLTAWLAFSCPLQVREFVPSQEEVAFLRAAEDAAFEELKARWKVNGAAASAARSMLARGRVCAARAVHEFGEPTIRQYWWATLLTCGCALARCVRFRFRRKPKPAKV